VVAQAGERRCPEDETLAVSEAFAQEQARLLELPGNPFPSDEIKVVSAGKTPYVRFDLNDYSIPHTCVSRSLTVSATPDEVRIFDAQAVIATHPRSYDRQQQIESPEHLAALVADKHQASAHRGTGQSGAADRCRRTGRTAGSNGTGAGGIARTLRRR